MDSAVLKQYVVNLVSERIHDDVIRNEPQGMNILHKHTGWDQMEFDVFQERGHDVLQIHVWIVVAVFLAPHQCRLGSEIGV